MNFNNIKLTALVLSLLSAGCFARAETADEKLVKAGEEFAKKYKKESADKTIGDWVGLLQCKTSAGDRPVEIIAIEVTKQPRGTCADETFTRVLAINSASKDYTCGLVDETLCLDAKKFDAFNDHFQKKRQDMPYIHFVDKNKRNQIMMVTPRYFKENGLNVSLDICRSKAKNLSVAAGLKAECIEPTK